MINSGTNFEFVYCLPHCYVLYDSNNRSSSLRYFLFTVCSVTAMINLENTRLVSHANWSNKMLDLLTAKSCPWVHSLYSAGWRKHLQHTRTHTSLHTSRAWHICETAANCFTRTSFVFSTHVKYKIYCYFINDFSLIEQYIRELVCCIVYCDCHWLLPAFR